MTEEKKVMKNQVSFNLKKLFVKDASFPEGELGRPSMQLNGRALAQRVSANHNTHTHTGVKLG